MSYRRRSRRWQRSALPGTVGATKEKLCGRAAKRAGLREHERSFSNISKLSG
jgi:hypothetical protein